RARGAQLIDLGIGNPDQPTPPVVAGEIAAASLLPANQGYPPFRGTNRFRHAVADFMSRRFGVGVEPEREVLAVSGAKEGLAQLTMAFLDESGASLVPDIHYPVHARATGLVGGAVHPLPLRAEGGWLPDLGAIPPAALRGARLLFLNYPHNPTGAVATRELYEEAVAFCARHGIVLVSDLAYSEITFDGYVAPSVLEVPGAKEVAIELHSCSKSFNMAGFRVGFAVGNASLIEALHAVRTNMGYGTPAVVQEGAALALSRAHELTPPIAERYRRRRDLLVEGFRSLGWEVRPPRAAMYLWLRVPAEFTSQRWTEHLIDTAEVVVTPGNAFGPGGEGYFRVSLVAEEEVLAGVIERLRRSGIAFAD
ncbi:MAG TPA: aminotransferase class I/II-fold pyridoxal phosphate-dependent enzyme, partial [Gemmatimonadaceae bacterium]|nr:aminotransferase class I/II-fold pyridoxal phosphate-dependent enzyme [Gemmatimonadaceae bacterium]